MPPPKFSENEECSTSQVRQIKSYHC
jgi:hypothetical protein